MFFCDIFFPVFPFGYNQLGSIDGYRKQRCNIFYFSKLNFKRYNNTPLLLTLIKTISLSVIGSWGIDGMFEACKLDTSYCNVKAKQCSDSPLQMRKQQTTTHFQWPVFNQLTRQDSETRPDAKVSIWSKNNLFIYQKSTKERDNCPATLLRVS